MPAQELKRVFRLSSLELADPAPDLPAEVAVKLYQASYPQLAVAQLSEPVVENGVLTYNIEKTDVKTKG